MLPSVQVPLLPVAKVVPQVPSPMHIVPAGVSMVHVGMGGGGEGHVPHATGQF